METRDFSALGMDRHFTDALLDDLLRSLCLQVHKLLLSLLIPSPAPLKIIFPYEPIAVAG